MGAWEEVQVEEGSEAPSGRGGAACVAISGRRVLYFGGADRTPSAFADWWLLELVPAGGLWTKISPVVKLGRKRKLLPRSGASLTYIPAGDGGAGRVYLFGGQDPVSGAIFDDLLCLDTASWELTDVQPERAQPRPPGRHSHVSGAFEQRGVVVYGGAGLCGPLADVWLFEPDAGSWRCLSAELAEEECPEGREMAAGAMISDAGLLVHGGRSADGALLDDINIFDCHAGRWVLMQATGSPRCAHTASNAAVLAQPDGSGGGAAAAAGPAACSREEQAAGGGGGGGAQPLASNVLLYGGFTGETVAPDLLQLTFVRQQRSSGSHGLRAELRPVKAAAEAAPPARFAHAAAVLSSTDSAELVVIGGVNQTDDLTDVYIWEV